MSSETDVLLVDVNGTFDNKTRYGTAGEKVTIVSHYGHVCIVEGKKGRFPVTEEKLLSNQIKQ